MSVKMPLAKRTSKRVDRHSSYNIPDEPITESILHEEISRMLTVSNENDCRNFIRYNFAQYEYKPITTFDTFTMLIEGSIDYKTVDEAQFTSDMADTTRQEEEGCEKNAIEGVDTLVRNQFNFSERAVQTVDCRPRHQLIQTEPPATAIFSANCNQAVIYDDYMNEFKEEKVRSEPCPTTLNPSANKPATVMERMIIQSLYDHLLQDFKYYEDPADDARGNFGCLLPLWKFNSELTKHLSVTGICWHPNYSDLFALSFGSFSYTKQGRGAILLYSLKNPSHPTYSYQIDCGVMTIDINPIYPKYLCAGLYDGSVEVYNLSRKIHQPEKRSERGVHNMLIYQIQWDKDSPDEQMCCNSVSPDGQVVKWIVAPNGLIHHVMVTLDISDFISKSMIEMKIMTFGSGITLDFHTGNNQIYLIGTEMGHAHLCSRAHSREALQTFEAHNSAVYKISWNTFHPKIFITCSEDWTVKIWEHTENIRKPLLVFDLGSQVYDVEWAPFSSTVFAAVTASGQVFVYDLAVDKSEPLCSQVVVFLKKTRVMHLTFNKIYHVILISDDQGEVICLKLSPNLRKMPKERKGKIPTDNKSREMLEISRLDEILTTFREKHG